jgi:dienelactone hydrolase
LTDSPGHGLNQILLDHMNLITTPASWYTTIFEKPIYVLQLIQYFVPFMIRCRESVVKPRIFEFAKALRTSSDTANMKIGAAGFCWGGLYAVKLAHDTPSSRVHRFGSEAGQVKSLIDAAFVAHPSMLNVPTDISAVTIPLAIAVGDIDLAMGITDVEKSKSILEKKGDDHEVVIYPGGKHGFAVRGDPKDPKQKELTNQAEAHAIRWFSKWLA